jgi:hypothetical protein
MCSVHVDRRKGKFQHIIKLNDTQTSNETITEVKGDMLTKETEPLIQGKGNSLVSMYHWLVFECYVSCDVDYILFVYSWLQPKLYSLMRENCTKVNISSMPAKGYNPPPLLLTFCHVSQIFVVTQ